jgi:hypothetical protein
LDEKRRFCIERGGRFDARDTASTMSEENVEAVRESYQTPGALFATWAERMAPKIEFDFTAVYPDRPVMRGIEELRRFRAEGPWASNPSALSTSTMSAYWSW